jgi:hypothetical protein
MTSGASNLYGVGNPRQLAVKCLMESCLQLLKADLDPIVTRLGHIGTHLDSIEIKIHAPFVLMLGPPLQTAYLQGILASNPITLSFGMDVWIPEKKLLNAWYTGRTIDIISFRRGVWENELISAAQHVEAGQHALILSQSPSRHTSSVILADGANNVHGLWRRIRSTLRTITKTSCSNVYRQQASIRSCAGLRASETTVSVAGSGLSTT